MLSSFFKKSEAEVQHNVNLKQSEQALQDRVNRMLRQSMPVDWTPPAMHPTMTQPRAIAEALRGKKQA